MNCFARRASAEAPDLDRESQPHGIPKGREILVIPDDDDSTECTKGQGTKDDPILFSEWTTGNLITNLEDGPIVIDDEEEDDRMSDVVVVQEHIAARVRSLSRTLSPEVQESGREKAVQMENDRSVPRIREPPQHLGVFAHFFQFDRPGIITPDSLPEHERSPSPEEDFEDEGYHTAEEDLDSPDPDEEMHNSGEEDEDTESIILIDVDDKEYVFTQDWSQIPEVKEELNDDVPALDFFTQETLDESSLDTVSSNPESAVYSKPTSVQESLHEPRVSSQSEEPKKNKAEKLRKKKDLFYNIYGPRILPVLGQRLNKKRPVNFNLNMDACWLYPGPLRENQFALELAVQFRHDGVKYGYRMNMGLVALLVDGLLTEEWKQGIINHSWHASHLCGNYYCTNPRHLVAEPGSINSKRVGCMKKPEEPCNHTPRCLKHLQIKERPGKVEKNMTQEGADNLQSRSTMEFF